MPILIPDRRFKGTTEITKTYHGDQLIWERPSAQQSFGLRGYNTVLSSTVSTTFSNMPLGDPSATRDVVVSVVCLNTSNAQASSVTIAGVAADLLMKQGAEGGAWNVFGSLWKARVPVGSVGDIVVTRVSSAANGVVSVTVHSGPDAVLSSFNIVGAGTGTTTLINTLSGAQAGDGFFGHGGCWASNSIDWSPGSEIFEINPYSNTRVGAVSGVADSGFSSISMTIPTGTRIVMAAFSFVP